jgi:hypothetical protein
VTFLVRVKEALEDPRRSSWTLSSMQQEARDQGRCSPPVGSV